jgi:dethiobiotin synthetase
MRCGGGHFQILILMQPIFITGIGTDVGKTVVAAIVTEALGASYWKPVQAGYRHGTDSQWVGERISHPEKRILPETYKLSLPASPHIAARNEGVTISPDRILRQLRDFEGNHPLVIEGAGGLLVPLNETDFVVDLVERMDTRLILVSRNYLGSINHSLMTAALCKARGLSVAGWIFNDQYQPYEQEIVRWSGIPYIASIPFHENPDLEFVLDQARRIRGALLANLTYL